MLSSKEAQKIVDNVDLPDAGDDPHRRIARLPKSERQALIQQKTTDDALVAAAVEIQRVWKGHFVRCKYFALTHPGESRRGQYQGSRFQHSEQGLRDVRTPLQEVPEVPRRFPAKNPPSGPVGPKYAIELHLYTSLPMRKHAAGTGGHSQHRRALRPLSEQSDKEETGAEEDEMEVKASGENGQPNEAGEIGANRAVVVDASDNGGDCNEELEEEEDEDSDEIADENDDGTVDTDDDNSALEDTKVEKQPSFSNLHDSEDATTIGSPRSPQTPDPGPEPQQQETSQEAVSTHGEDKTLQRMKLETAYKNYVEQMVRQGRALDRAEIFSFNDFCASEIQKAWRGSHKGRAISKPLSAMSSGLSFLKEEETSEPISERKAAMKIQRAWRRHIDVQVYRYYRDLINFKGKGDPAMMLRCINPNESKLLDSAMGAHVKFRLAGERFPPNIYYKIFTHRTIIDLCANSPKDYTKAAILQVEAKQKHNRTKHKPVVDDMQGWYERIENNGWRLVSDRLLQNAQQDIITWETSRKKVDFHHNKLKRKQDVEKKRKKKKVEWMMKMYKEGMLRAKSADSHTSTLIQDAADGIVRVAQEKGPDSIQDWEVDELLDWTNGLNFDEYMDTWKEIGTSAASERQINIISADPAAFALSSVAHLIDTPKGSRTSGAQSKHQSPHPGAMDSHPPSRPTPGTPEPEAY